MIYKYNCIICNKKNCIGETINNYILNNKNYYYICFQCGSSLNNGFTIANSKVYDSVLEQYGNIELLGCKADYEGPIIWPIFQLAYSFLKENKNIIDHKLYFSMKIYKVELKNNWNQDIYYNEISKLYHLKNKAFIYQNSK